MSKETITYTLVARRYAKALFETADQAGQVDVVKSDLNDLVHTMDENALKTLRQHGESKSSQRDAVKSLAEQVCNTAYAQNFFSHPAGRGSVDAFA